MSQTQAARRPNVRARFRPHQGRFLPECFEGMVGGHFLALDH